MKLLKYEGNDKYFLGLVIEPGDEETNSKYYILSGKIAKIEMEISSEENHYCDYDSNLGYSKMCITNETFGQIILNLARNNNILFNLVKINSIDEYDKIIPVVKMLL